MIICQATNSQSKATKAPISIQNENVSSVRDSTGLRSAINTATRWVKAAIKKKKISMNPHQTVRNLNVSIRTTIMRHMAKNAVSLFLMSLFIFIYRRESGYVKDYL